MNTAKLAILHVPRPLDIISTVVAADNASLLATSSPSNDSGISVADDASPDNRDFTTQGLIARPASGDSTSNTPRKRKAISTAATPVDKKRKLNNTTPVATKNPSPPRKRKASALDDQSPANGEAAASGALQSKKRKTASPSKIANSEKTQSKARANTRKEYIELPLLTQAVWNKIDATQALVVQRQSQKSLLISELTMHATIYEWEIVAALTTLQLDYELPDRFVEPMIGDAEELIMNRTGEGPMSRLELRFSRMTQIEKDVQAKIRGRGLALEGLSLVQWELEKLYWNRALHRQNRLADAGVRLWVKMA